MRDYIIIGAVATVIIGVAVYTFIRNRKIRRDGVETDAVISRIDEQRSTSYEGGADYMEYCFVTYVDSEGRTVEAQLDHAPGNARVGEKVRIKYLPEKPHQAVLVK